MIDLDPGDFVYITCEAYDLRKSVKYSKEERIPRAEYVGQSWHCDLGSNNPKIMENHNYYRLTKEDKSRYRYLKPLKSKKYARIELMSIL